MFGHFLRTGAAVHPHHRDIERVDDGGGGGDVGADEQATGSLDGDVDENRRVDAGGGAGALGAVDRGFDLQSILAGLDQNGVDTAGDEAAALLGERVLQIVIRNIAERWQLGARADAAEYPARTAIGEALGGLAGDFAGALVDFEGAVGKVEFGEGNGRGAKAVGFHHIGAGGEVVVVDVANQVGARQAEHVGAILAAPVVGLDIEGQGLDMAAHAAVGEQDVVGKRVEQRAAGHRVASMARSAGAGRLARPADQMRTSNGPRTVCAP